MKQLKSINKDYDDNKSMKKSCNGSNNKFYRVIIAVGTTPRTLRLLS